MEERRNTHPQGADHSRKRRKVRPGHVAGGVVMTVFTLVLIGICTTLMLLGIFMKYVNTSLLPTLEVRAEDYTMSQSSVVYYQDKESGQWVEFQKVHGQENRVLIDIDDMSPYLWQAAVSIEDERFFSHHGVDWKRTLGATLLTLTGSNDSYGGSTITQQMLKNMTGENQNTINRKVKEIFRALEFEKNNTKSQILELYLNMIYLGSGCGGVETAAEYYFGKPAKDLTAAESACIIAITNNPSLSNPKYERTYTRKDHRHPPAAEQEASGTDPGQDGRGHQSGHRKALSDKRGMRSRQGGAFELHRYLRRRQRAGQDRRYRDQQLVRGAAHQGRDHRSGPGQEHFL